MTKQEYNKSDIVLIYLQQMLRQGYEKAVIWVLKYRGILGYLDG